MLTFYAQNWFATLALLFFPLVGVWLYSTRPVAQATILTLLAGYLLLPMLAYIKIPGVPQFDKVLIPNLVALFGCLLIAPSRLRSSNRFGLVGFLLFVSVASPFVTAELNPDPVVLSYMTLPGETHYDAFSASVGQALILIPFFLGWQLLRQASDTVEILRLLLIAGLLYSLPVLYEVRMSPQLHVMFYGFFQHSWEQVWREGGFRPIVFLYHGIWVAFYMATALVAAAAFWRMKVRIVPFAPTSALAVYFGVILFLCKTLSAQVYGAVLFLLVRFMTPRIQMICAVVFACIALTYPLLRTSDWIPTDRLLEWAGSISEDREASLRVRFESEAQLLDRAHQRLVFGWGRWGRGLVNEAVGYQTSIPDGRWVGLLGTFGLIGFLAEFGLLALAVFRAASSLKFVQSEVDKIGLAALTLIVAINMIDMLPNATLTPLTWLMAGALVGRAEALRTVAKGNVRDAVTAEPLRDPAVVKAEM
jgi:hypothetical protein